MKKRIYFILMNENIFHPLYLERVLQRLPKEYEVVGVTIAIDPHGGNIIKAVLNQINLWGFFGFLYIVLRSAIFSILDFTNIFKTSSIKSICKTYRLSFTVSKNVNSEEHISLLSKLSIDILVSSNPQIFKKKLLSIPKIACINRHSSLLPKYGGIMPIFWAMFFEEKEFGVSYHYMTEKIDQGDIICQEPIPIDLSNSLFHNYVLAFRKSVEVLFCALDAIKNGEKTKQFFHNDKEYFVFPQKSEIDKLRDKGYKTFKYSDIFTSL